MRRACLRIYTVYIAATFFVLLLYHLPKAGDRRLLHSVSNASVGMDKIFFLAVATHGTFSPSLCQTCVRDVEKLINLRQNIQKEEDTLRKLFRRAGEAKIYYL